MLSSVWEILTFWTFQLEDRIKPMAKAMLPVLTIPCAKHSTWCQYRLKGLGFWTSGFGTGQVHRIALLSNTGCWYPLIITIDICNIIVTYFSDGYNEFLVVVVVVVAEQNASLSECLSGV